MGFCWSLLASQFEMGTICISSSGQVKGENLKTAGFLPLPPDPFLLWPNQRKENFVVHGEISSL